MASPLKREVSPAAAIVVIMVVLAAIIGAYWYLSQGSASGSVTKPARPIQPPPNVVIPQGAGPTAAPR